MMARIIETECDIGPQHKSPVIGHVLAAVPGQRLVGFFRLLACFLYQHVDHCPNIFTSSAYRPDELAV